MIALLVALLLGQQVPTPPQAPPVRAEIPGYDDASQLAIKTGKPLLVLVGIYDKAKWEGMPGIIVCQTLKLEGYQLGDIVLCVPNNSELYWRATFDANTATGAAIRAALVPRAVQPAAAPFDSSNVQAPPVADDDRDDAVASGRRGGLIAKIKAWRAKRR
jgi:hypothetical protein